MKPKTFRAPDMLTALKQVQEELGSEALIVSVRKTPGGPAWQVWRKPDIEVVAMPNPNPASETKKELPAKAAPSKPQMPERSAKVANRLPKNLSKPMTPAERAEAVKLAKELKKKLYRPPEIPPEDRLEVAGTAPVKKPVVNEPPVKPASVLPAIKPIINVPPEKRNGGEAVAKKENPAQDGAQVPANMPDALEHIHHRLLVQGVDRKLINRIITTSLSTLSERSLEDNERVYGFIRKQLEACIRVAPDAFMNDRIVYLIGTSGCGKTSVCAKFAAYAISRHKREVVWVSADTVRTGAIAESRVFTEMLGVPLHLVYTPEELIQIVSGLPADKMIVIDTPGYNPYNQANVIELGSLLTALPNRSTYLVVPATAKESDLNDAIAYFGPFNLKGLVFTKVDETRTYGNIFNVAWRSKQPVLNVTTGTRILEDLRPARINDIVDMLFREEAVQ